MHRGFINNDVFDNVPQDLLSKLPVSINTDVVRGYGGNPAFVVEMGQEIVAEIRPTERMNYVLYTPADGGELSIHDAFQSLTAALKEFVDIAVTNQELRHIHLTREFSYYESLNCSLSLYGVTHTFDRIENMLKHELNKYTFDTILHEEHIKNGFDPQNVTEHRAIDSYHKHHPATSVRSMDVPNNSKHLDSLADVMVDLANDLPKTSHEELNDEDGMIKYNGRYEADVPQLYSFAQEFRNDFMAAEIIKEAQKDMVGHIAIVVGMSHLFGSNSITGKIEEYIISE
jgi:hypothetical protein